MDGGAEKIIGKCGQKTTTPNKQNMKSVRVLMRMKRHSKEIHLSEKNLNKKRVWKLLESVI